MSAASPGEFGPRADPWAEARPCGSASPCAGLESWVDFDCVGVGLPLSLPCFGQFLELPECGGDLEEPLFYDIGCGVGNGQREGMVGAVVAWGPCRRDMRGREGTVLGG